MLYLVVGNRVRRLDNAKAIDRIGYKQNTHTLVSEYSSISTHLIPGTKIEESWTRWRRNKVVPARRRCDRQYYKRKPKPSPPKTGSPPAKTNKTSFIGQASSRTIILTISSVEPAVTQKNAHPEPHDEKADTTLNVRI